MSERDPEIEATVIFVRVCCVVVTSVALVIGAAVASVVWR